MRLSLAALLAVLALAGCATPEQAAAPSTPSSPAPQPVIDKCAGVSCPDGCSGTTFQRGGSCEKETGTCAYETAIGHSSACGG